MASLRTTFIATVLNEEKTIVVFLNSLQKQSVEPDEIIITDGGSTDSTFEILQRFAKKKKLSIKTLQKKGNRAIGRNFAIQHAKNDIILCADAGCSLEKDWVKNIIKPFVHKNIDVVAGYYKGIGKNTFEKCIIPYALVMPDRVNPYSFLPATRSMAFRKTIWKEIEGFDETLSHNEDYAFARRLKASHKQIFFMQNAVVYWYPPQTLRKFFKMIYRFALGDAEAKILRSKVLMLFIRYIIAIILLVLAVSFHSALLWEILLLLFILYILWSISKNYKYVKNVSAIFYLPLLQLVSDVAVIAGTIVGLS